MNRDDARKKWKESGLDYSILSKENLYGLARRLNHELINFKEWKENCNVQSAWIELHYLKRNPFYCYQENGKLIWVEFTLDSQYFSKRECITFNGDGFIGFAGWACDKNVQPILKAFCDWVDWVKDQPKPMINPIIPKADPLKNVKPLDRFGEIE